MTLDLNISFEKEWSERTPGQRITKARIENGWNIKQLSEKSGISETSISRYERDLITPSLKTYVKLSDNLNKSISYLSDYDLMPEKTLAEKIKKYRYLKGWSHRMFAKKANLDPSTILKIESSKTRNPTNKTIRKIEEVLSVILNT